MKKIVLETTTTNTISFNLHMPENGKVDTYVIVQHKFACIRENLDSHWTPIAILKSCKDVEDYLLTSWELLAQTDLLNYYETSYAEEFEYSTEVFAFSSEKEAEDFVLDSVNLYFLHR